MIYITLNWTHRKYNHYILKTSKLEFFRMRVGFCGRTTMLPWLNTRSTGALVAGTQSRDGNRSSRPALVGSRFFDRPVKPVETPVMFSFLATIGYLSTNRNIRKYFVINETCYKKTVLTKHAFLKHVLNGFKLSLL